MSAIQTFRLFAAAALLALPAAHAGDAAKGQEVDRKSTRLNSSH